MNANAFFDYAKDYNINIIEEDETENNKKKKDFDVVEEAVARRILRLLLLLRCHRRHKSYFRKPLSFNSCMKDSDTERLTDS